MDLGLTDKVALVTGASKGIGKAVALTLAAEGARVAVVARDAGALDKVVAECRDRSRKDAVAVAADLSGLEATERVVREVKERCGRIDILVNNAGAIRGGEFLKIPDAQWMGDWNLKLLGYIRMARAVLPIMQAQGGGAIVNIASVSGVRARPNSAAYSSSKAALIHLGAIAAIEAAPHKIRVNTIIPGATTTPSFQRAFASMPPQDLKALGEGQVPLGRFANAQDVAKGVLFMLSDEAGFVTGAELRVEGGAFWTR